MYFRSIAVVSILAALADLASAHCKITSATGNDGGKGSAIGIVPGSANSETDVTIFSGTTGCGKTPGAGANNIQTGTQAVISQNGGTLPQVSAGGSLTMTLHQVNADGAGPFTCSINTDGTGNSFTALQVTTQVPGTKGDSTANNQDFPLVAAMPANLQCTGTVGGASNVCIVACKNPVGPFGGCVPVQQAGGTSSGTGTSAAAPAAAVSSAIATTLKTLTTAKAKAPASSAPAPAQVAASSVAAAVASAVSSAVPSGTATTGNTTGTGHHHHHKAQGQASAC